MIAELAKKNANNWSQSVLSNSLTPLIFKQNLNVAFINNINNSHLFYYAQSLKQKPIPYQYKVIFTEFIPQTSSLNLFLEKNNVNKNMLLSDQNGNLINNFNLNQPFYWYHMQQPPYQFIKVHLKTKPEITIITLLFDNSLYKSMLYNSISTHILIQEKQFSKDEFQTENTQFLLQEMNNPLFTQNISNKILDLVIHISALYGTQISHHEDILNNVQIINLQYVSKTWIQACCLSTDLLGPDISSVILDLAFFFNVAYKFPGYQTQVRASSNFNKIILLMPIGIKSSGIIKELALYQLLWDQLSQKYVLTKLPRIILQDVKQLSLFNLIYGKLPHLPLFSELLNNLSFPSYGLGYHELNKQFKVCISQFYFLPSTVKNIVNENFWAEDQNNLLLQYAYQHIKRCSTQRTSSFRNLDYKFIIRYLAAELSSLLTNAHYCLICYQQMDDFQQGFKLSQCIQETGVSWQNQYPQIFPQLIRAGRKNVTTPDLQTSIPDCYIPYPFLTAMNQIPSYISKYLGHVSNPFNFKNTRLFFTTFPSPPNKDYEPLFFIAHVIEYKFFYCPNFEIALTRLQDVGKFPSKLITELAVDLVTNNKYKEATLRQYYLLCQAIASKTLPSQTIYQDQPSKKKNVDNSGFKNKKILADQSEAHFIKQTLTNVCINNKSHHNCILKSFFSIINESQFIHFGPEIDLTFKKLFLKAANNPNFIDLILENKFYQEHSFETIRKQTDFHAINKSVETSTQL